MKSLALALPLLLAACGSEPTPDQEGHGAQDGHAHAAADAVALPAPSADATAHALRCGCAVEGVGTCSEYIEVDGEWVALELPGDLGSMPFCGRDDLVARVDGALEDGVFVAETFAYVD